MQNITGTVARFSFCIMECFHQGSLCLKTLFLNETGRNILYRALIYLFIQYHILQRISTLYEGVLKSSKINLESRDHICPEWTLDIEEKELCVQTVGKPVSAARRNRKMASHNPRSVITKTIYS